MKMDLIWCYRTKIQKLFNTYYIIEEAKEKQEK